MCGIAGKITFQGQVQEGELLKMTNTLKHRGPSDSGVYINDGQNIGLGSRRLSIIDLSAAGHMPLIYLNRYYIVHNGEIYNFQELREKLERDGYKFKSKTDTEVVPALYDKYKNECVKYLRGMFAFAIYDKSENVLFAARDRMGQKPFKYYWNGNNFIFASELKAILTQKEVKKEPDFTAIHHYLTLGYVPAPMTGFVNIKKLPPAHSLTLKLSDKSLNIKRYWQNDFNSKEEKSEQEWCSEILETLEESVSMRMISDVPLGAFLSGGVDSSAVVATMARLSTKPIKTFTVSQNHPRYDETEHAERLSKMYKTDHSVLTLRKSSLSLLPKLAYQYEEPFADGSALVTFMISELASQHVQVILNGDGGDENFVGYERYLRLRRDIQLDKLEHLIPPARVLTALADRSLANPEVARIKRFLDKSRLPIAERFLSYNSYLAHYDKLKLYNSDFKTKMQQIQTWQLLDKIFSEAPSTSLFEKALYFDQTNYLADDLLVKVDIASMANGLEARSPLLDHKMVELAAKIPVSLKLKKNEYKYIFKKALEKIVPAENLYRPKKGFSIPLAEWFEEQEMKKFADNVITKNEFLPTIFSINAIKPLLSSHSKENDNAPKIWTILNLALWWNAYFG